MIHVFLSVPDNSHSLNLRSSCRRRSGSQGHVVHSPEPNRIERAPIAYEARTSYLDLLFHHVFSDILGRSFIIAYGNRSLAHGCSVRDHWQALHWLKQVEDGRRAEAIDCQGGELGLFGADCSSQPLAFGLEDVPLTRLFYEFASLRSLKSCHRLTTIESKIPRESSRRS